MTKINDLMDYEFLQGILVSDDDEKIAYKKTQANLKDNKYDTDLFVYDKSLVRSYRISDNKKASLYSFDSENNLIYKKDSDEDYDYFYKNDGKGIGDLAFKIDKDLISIERVKDETYLILASDKKSEEEKNKEKEEDFYKELTSLPFWSNGTGYLKNSEKTYYLYDLREDRLTEILKSDDKNEVNGLAISNDLTRIAYLKGHRDNNGVMEFLESIILKDLKTGEEKILVDKGYSIYTVDFIEDKLIFVGTDMKKGGINEDAFIYEVDFTGQVKMVNDSNFDKSFGNSIGTDARWEGNRTFMVHKDRLYFIATEYEESKLYSINLAGDLRLEIEGCVEDFYVTDDDISYLEMGADHLAELKVKSKENSLIENKIEGTLPIEEFTFKSNGDDLRGYVLLPKDFDPEKKYPTILSVHGGPKTEFSDIFHHEHQMLASEGFIIIYTNPHGSSGRGVKFSDIRGRYGEIDYEDLMTFTDEAIKRYDQIDPDKLAIYGGSYGGFMTNWAIGHTDRFKAAVSQRSISNWTSFYGVSDIGYYFGSDQTGADPWDDMDKMWDESPIKYADKANTPTLFIHADSDYRCPLEQGLQMYNKLKLNGVDTRMVVFHGENHELSRSGKPRARVKRLAEIKSWFEKHLKDETK
ncbi:S9 family peptidase [uncultured Anaerococcus sp.]|uniref:alpha/beta hydrolase family protein n=1 Tax=uncultured Anaerococcus sp. TaxID=293428 RepID=UPI0025FA736C|nr:S9 family peptidase [uncultured Anaerococcus sp.]